MNTSLKLRLLCASFFCASIAGISAPPKPEDLAPLATHTALILGGAYSSHLDGLERIFRGEGLGLPPSEKERCLSLLAGLKKEVRQHIDTANTMSRSVNLYGKSELIAQSFGLHVILSQCAYRALSLEQVLIECVSDSKWRLQFKKDRGSVHIKLLDHQERCYTYALGIL